MKVKRMRLLVWIVTFVLLLWGTLWADESWLRAKQVLVFDSQSVAAGGSATSRKIDLKRTRGYFSLQYVLTGDGTVTLSYELSNDGNIWIFPSTCGDSFPLTGLTKTSGPGGDGKDIVPVKPIIARFIRFKVTETGGANGVTISARLNYQ